MEGDGSQTAEGKKGGGGKGESHSSLLVAGKKFFFRLCTTRRILFQKGGRREREKTSKKLLVKFFCKGKKSLPKSHAPISEYSLLRGLVFYYETIIYSLLRLNVVSQYVLAYSII